ncbi:hypothetical protein D3C76_282360 [compost metagenome]
MTKEFSNQYYLESAPMKKAIAHLSVPMMIGMSVGITQSVLFIPMIIVLHATLGLHGVIWSMTVTEVITSVMGVILFMIFRKKLKSTDGDGKGVIEVVPCKRIAA